MWLEWLGGLSGDFIVRVAEPGDAEALTRLAETISAEPEGWLISADGEWRRAVVAKGVAVIEQAFRACFDPCPGACPGISAEGTSAVDR